MPDIPVDFKSPLECSCRSKVFSLDTWTSHWFAKCQGCGKVYELNPNGYAQIVSMNA